MWTGQPKIIYTRHSIRNSLNTDHKQVIYSSSAIDTFYKMSQVPYHFYRSATSTLSRASAVQYCDTEMSTIIRWNIVKQVHLKKVDAWNLKHSCSTFAGVEQLSALEGYQPKSGRLFLSSEINAIYCVIDTQQKSAKSITT